MTNESLYQFQSKGFGIVTDAAVRRFPVVDAEGNLQGIITIDNIIRIMGREMAEVAQVIEKKVLLFSLRICRR